MSGSEKKGSCVNLVKSLSRPNEMIDGVAGVSNPGDTCTEEFNSVD